ncbi:MAG: DUF481 domain-containing protein [Kiritimatiellaceae bacterium]|nr:DUF481 domain-containing protein [Kiritimatiellaceae bacterium]
MKKYIGVAWIALLALPFAGMAEEAKGTNVAWKSSVSLGATYKSGNTEKSLFTMNLKGDRYAEKSDWLSSLYGEHGKTEGDQTEGQLRGQSDYRYKFGSKNFFGGVFGEGYYDVIKGIRTRLKLGPNIGYYFINKDTMKLDASFGVNAVYERTATTEENFAEYRAALNYLWEFSKMGSYYLNLEYTANVEDTDDGNGLLVTGVKSKLSEQLAVFIEVRDEYDNTPPVVVTGPPVEYANHADVTVVAGLTYDF